MNGLPLSLDWMGLTLQLLSPVGKAPEGHKWACYSPTNVWASRWCLYNEYGEKVFTLLFQPRQSIIKSNRALLEISNEWLYHGIGVTGCLALLEKCCTFGILGVSRADLAVDFCPDLAMKNVIFGLFRNEIYVAGKQNGNGWWSNRNDKKLAPMWKGFCPHDMNWGHKTSDVKWKLYYKTKELRDEAGGMGFSKPYIVDKWREFGMDIDNVWRLEVSVKHGNNFDYKGQPLTFDALMHDTEQLFKSLYTSRFIIRKNEGHKDKTNDAVVEFLPIGKLRDAFKVNREEHDVAHNSCLTLLRHLINDLQTEQVLMNDQVREAAIAMLGQLIEINQLGRYFYTIVGESYDSWVEFLRVKAYYYGEEYNKKHAGDDGSTLDAALVEAGMVRTPGEQFEDSPLGAPSSRLPQRSATQQMPIMFNP